MAVVVITLEDDGDDGVKLSVRGLPSPVRDSLPLTPAQALALTIQAKHQHQEPVLEYSGSDD